MQAMLGSRCAGQPSCSGSFTNDAYSVPRASDNQRSRKTRSASSRTFCTTELSVLLPRSNLHASKQMQSSRAKRRCHRTSQFRASTAFQEGIQSTTSAAEVAASPPQSFSRISAPIKDKVGVLLLNLGGPETLEDVQPFLYNLFADDSIIRLPAPIKFMQPYLASWISTLRAPKSSEGYKAIGGGSPLRRITEEQAAALSEALARKGQQAEVYVAMRYWKPFTEDAIKQVKEDGITRLVILPLYPQFSVSTSGSSLRLFESMLEKDAQLRAVAHTVIPSWYSRPGYISAMADLIQTELERFAKAEEIEIFFSAHGVPKSYVEEAGDPYKEEMEHTVDLIMQELKRRGVDNHSTLAYQSRVGPVEWLRPYTDDKIRELGADGTKGLLAVPVSFVSEHIETLEEIDMEYRELAEESGIAAWGRVPALNTNAKFIEDLADAVMEALPWVGYGTAPNPMDAMVPPGNVKELLETYDPERRMLAPPVLLWQWGWTKSAEVWNGRIAMLAVVFILIVEAASGQGVLSRWLLL